MAGVGPAKYTKFADSGFVSYHARLPMRGMAILRVTPPAGPLMWSGDS